MFNQYRLVNGIFELLHTLISRKDAGSQSLPPGRLIFSLSVLAPSREKFF